MRKAIITMILGFLLVGFSNQESSRINEVILNDKQKKSLMENIIFDKGYHDYKGRSSEGIDFLITIYPRGKSFAGSILIEGSKDKVKITGKINRDEMKLYYKGESDNNIEFFRGTMKTIDAVSGEINLSKFLGGNEDIEEVVELSLRSIITGEYGKRYAAIGAEEEEEIEDYASEIYQYIINSDKQGVAAQIKFPIDVHINSESRTRIYNAEEFIKEYDNIINPEFKSIMERAFTRNMFTNYQGVMLGDGQKNIWFTFVKDDSGRMLKIIGINN